MWLSVPARRTDPQLVCGGGFQVVRVYGSLDSDRCQKRAYWFADYADALAYIEQLHAHRVEARHYTLVSRFDPEKF